MDKEKFIANQLAVRIANLEVDKAELQAENALLTQKIKEYEEEANNDVKDQ